MKAITLLGLCCDARRVNNERGRQPRRPQIQSLWDASQQLLLAVFFRVDLGSFVRVMPGVKRVAPCGMRMMGRFFVVSALVMFGCFAVVARGMRMVFCRLLMVLGCFLGHSGISYVGCLLTWLTPPANNGTPT